MNTPLADRIRPTELADVVGQRHLLTPGKALYNMINGGDVPNLIFYGPSGGAKPPLRRLLQIRLTERFASSTAQTLQQAT